jgi:SAM-dependent methyltransferase
MLTNDRRLNYGRHLITEWSADIKSENPCVLDVGAGEGIDLGLVRDQLGNSARYVAIESWRPFVEPLKSKGVEVFDINIERERLPLEDESVDLIIANQIFEHTKELFWIMHEFSRVLKVGGQIIVGVPNLAALHNRILLLFGQQPTCIRANGAHVRGFTQSGMKQIINVWGGYSLTAFRGANFIPLPNNLAKIAANLLPSFAVCIFSLYKKTMPYDGLTYLDYPGEQKLATNYYVGDVLSDFD